MFAVPSAILRRWSEQARQSPPSRSPPSSGQVVSGFGCDALRLEDEQLSESLSNLEVSLEQLLKQWRKWA